LKMNDLQQQMDLIVKSLVTISSTLTKVIAWDMHLGDINKIKLISDVQSEIDKLVEATQNGNR